MNLTDEQKKIGIEILDKFFKFYKTSPYGGISDNIESFKKEYLTIKPKIEVGKAYKNECGSILFVTKLNDSNTVSGYGTYPNGLWTKSDSWGLEFNLQPITKKEWIAALKKEGDKYIGKTVKCEFNGDVQIVKYFYCLDNDGDLVYNDEKEDVVYLMKNGKWAEVIEDEIKQETITIEVKKGTKVIIKEI